ncbi:MAG: glycosyltransferase [Alphaproteobacteria bacterium]|nr:glycosyltransferase [Alphaproteobacteria bacterium]
MPDHDAASGLRISVIMPAFNAIGFLKQALPPLIAMRDRGEVLEVIVADDESTDDTPLVAAELGARVVKNPKRGGPGAARNFAAPLAQGEILWFVDADVIAHPGGADRIRDAFKEAGVVALHGSYDDRPPAKNFMSQYKNLMHRFYHQMGKREASTFWAGCGAVRKDAFLAVGGFDTVAYHRPSIEDIDLGYRLRARGGRLLLVPELEGTHLKYWTLQNALFTDIFRRALPWARLMLTREGLTDDLNVSQAERWRAVYAGLLVLSLAAPIVSASLWWLPLAMFVGAIAINWKLFSFFASRKNPFFALVALGYHQIYYLYSAAVFVWCVIESKTPGLRRAAPRLA